MGRCALSASIAEEGGRGEQSRRKEEAEAEAEVYGKGGRGRTHEIGVIRPKFLVQFDSVRFVYGVPERHPVGDDGVDIFRRRLPGKKKQPRARLPVSENTKPLERWANPTCANRSAS